MLWTQSRQSTPWSNERANSSGIGWTIGRMARHAIGAGFGAIAGAGAMYLLDPEMGSDRRHRLADRANETLDHAADAIRDTAYYARQRASDAGASILEHGSSLVESAGESLHATRKRLPRLGDFRSRRNHAVMESAPAIALSGIALVALGAGAMWLFDARLGRGRRAWLGQKATRAASETGRFMRSTGRHFRNKARGYTHRASAGTRRNVTQMPEKAERQAISYGITA